MFGVGIYSVGSTNRNCEEKLCPKSMRNSFKSYASKMHDAPEHSSSVSKRRRTTRSISRTPAKSVDSNCNGNVQDNGSDTNAEESEEVKTVSDLQNCTVCGVAKSQSLLDLTDNHVMRRRFSKDWKMPNDVVECTLKAICVECVCKVNMHSEVTRTLMQKLQRLSTSAATTKPKQKKISVADAAVSTTLAELQDAAVSTLSRSRRTTGSSCSLGLRAYSSQPPESPSATESGGARNKNSNISDGWKWRTRLECPFCARVYIRKDYYMLHLRRCTNSHKQMRPSQCRVLNEAECGTADSKSVYKKKTAQRQRQFYCDKCKIDFKTMNALGTHERTAHLLRQLCSFCGAEFNTKCEWELHYTICKAKNEALLSNNATHSVRTVRSCSPACSSALDDEDEDVDAHAKNDDDDEDNVSETETMYTRRMNFTGDWILSHSRSNSNSALNQSVLYDEYVQEESLITTEKEYDLYLLDLLKTQVQLKTFTCFAPSCHYQTNTLVDLMKHDYKQHWKMSWFYCQKCGDVFTSKVFLDYHLHRQNRGAYICHKCHDEFEFQHQLDRHLLLHSKGINYHCNFCRLEFLSEAKLLAHCKLEQHSPNDEPALICIDHTLTICNPVPVTPAESHQYGVRILNVPCSPLSSHRVMHLPHHKPFRFAIGICEFDSRNPPNCVGCH